MKKIVQLFVIIAMLSVLIACGYGEGKKSETQAGYEQEQGVSILSVDENSAECGNAEREAALGYEYEKDIIRYGEASGPVSSGTVSFRKDMERTQTDYAVYYFEPSIKEQERQACIAATDRALSCIDGTLPLIEIAVFLPETFDDVFVSDSRLYTLIQSWDSTEYLAEVLLAGYSEWGNYGLAYGYANHLCKEAGLDYRETTGFLPMSEPELYDLTLLCFNEKFASSEDVEAAENNACLFVDGYLSTHSEAELLELLSGSGTVEGVGRANEALEAFYAENGVDSSLTQIRYQYGGVTYEYAAACEYARFYLDKDWQNMGWERNAKVSENFLHENYAEVKTFFECSVRQMAQYQEFFDFDSYNNDLPVMITNKIILFEKEMYSGYYYADHTIYLADVESLPHEYIHSLTYGRFDFDNWWKKEGTAQYFSYKYNDYLYSTADWYYELSETDVLLREFLDSLGRPLDLAIDRRGIDDMLVYIWEQTNPVCSYEAAASFVGYLVDQYGEQAVIAYVRSNVEYNAKWGKSYDELVQDWNDYINENYSWCDTEFIQ